ncbi:neuropilin and tolloid-like protein 1 [Biomphalaria glabrata]|uniref:Neuropilin and tolloid-like protein 1 n=1 Tax=Biomphalaria glabrata TaxID=6526 RepID=A0A9U8EIP8_BIOGL|nr:neuropilin and tolloid-like protein 1 [Biomphalaria glabrata]KAI8790359.1 neuropilin and tolloid protein 1 [Biomphalaria glabrata]
MYSLGTLQDPVILILILFSFVIFFCVPHAAADVPLYYLSDYCSNTLDMDISKVQAGRLLLHRPNQPLRDTNCQMIVKAPVNKKLTFKFHHFNVHSPQGCNNNHLQLFDDEQFSVPLSGQLCNSAGPSKAYITSTETASIRLTKDQFLNDQVDLVFTAFNFAPCTGGTYACRNDHCIASELYCNGLDNCGDESDICVLRAKTVIAIIIAVVVVAVVLAIILGVYLFRRQRRIRRERVSG